MNIILDALTHTPWWVFVLFFYLLRVGIKATRPRVIPLKRLFILPAVFLFISFNSFLSVFQFTWLTSTVYFLSLLAGLMFGWVQVQSSALKFDHKNKLIKIPGSFVTLSVILIIFSTKYFFGYKLATDPTIIENAGFITFRLGISGVCAGLLLGRAVCYLVRKSQAPNENLKPL